ncbi:agmatinase [Lachnospiraceae bacterium RM5]|nr:agmatinase [Lachnospiraceae bacterium RM5]
MLNKMYQEFIGCDKEFDESSIVLFGAPFDSTTSNRPGARFGSKAIRDESYGLETYSPYQDKDLEDTKIFDMGDIELPFGDSKKALEMIGNVTKEILKNEKMPFMLGGEHLVTLGAFNEVYRKYPDIRLIQFDAHTDLRDEYLNVKLSHACVVRRIWDMIGDGKIYQFGIRSGMREEFYWAKEHTTLNKYNLSGLDKAIEEIKDYPVYLTIDLDVLDPGIMPGTGTPEAGGISFNELIDGIKKMSGLNIVAVDVNELAPNLDMSGASSALACKVVRELLLMLYR